MGKLKKLLVFLTSINFMLGNPTKINSAASDSGIDLNVKVNEDVPNHLCTRFFQNLEVRSVQVFMLKKNWHVQSPNILLTKLIRCSTDTNLYTFEGRKPTKRMTWNWIYNLYLKANDVFSKTFQSLLNSTSDLLEHETGSSLSRVTIQLPASMMSSPCMTNITMTKVNHVTSDTTDVTITGRDPVFGSTPFTIQHGGCGTRGRRVTLPSDSLVQADNVTSDMGKINCWHFS